MKVQQAGIAQVLCDTKYLQLKKTVSPNGGDWFYAHRPNAQGAVVIAPILHDDKLGDRLVFLETKRPPIYAEGKAQTCIEFPAGLVGDEVKGETARQAIKKELLEETGYKASKIKIVAPLVTSSSGMTSETSLIAIADVAKDQIIKSPISDDGIIVNIHKIHIDKVDSWLKSQQRAGKAVASQVFSALYFIIQRCTKAVK